MPDFEFDTSQLDAARKRLDFNAVRHVVGKEAVRALKSPQSLWPVDTGYSKRNFGYRVSQDQIIITNRADYANYPEQGIPNPRTRGLGARTIRNAEADLIRVADDEIRRQLDG